MGSGKISRRLAVALLLLAAPVAAAAADQPAEAPFRIGEAAMTMPIPAGLCLPTGDSAAIAQMTAAADGRNVTVADFWTCGAAEQAGTHYVLLKVPTQVLLMRLPKEDTLASLNATLTGPDSPKFGGDFDRMAKEGIDKVTGLQTKVESDFGYISRDADCIYMGGRVSIAFEAGKPAKPGLVATCMTVVGEKLVNVNVYDNRPDTGINAVMNEAHAIALTIRRTNPAN